MKTTKIKNRGKLLSKMLLFLAMTTLFPSCDYEDSSNIIRDGERGKKVEVVFINNPKDTIVYENVIRTCNTFVLKENGKEIVIDNLLWFKTYKGTKYYIPFWKIWWSFWIVVVVYSIVHDRKHIKELFRNYKKNKKIKYYE